MTPRRNRRLTAAPGESGVPNVIRLNRTVEFNPTPWLANARRMMAWFSPPFAVGEQARGGCGTDYCPARSRRA